MTLDPDAPRHRFDPVEFEDEAWDDVFGGGGFALVGAIVVVGVVAIVGFVMSVYWPSLATAAALLVSGSEN